MGLLHDLDYEQFPEEHCHKVVEIMQEEGIDDFIFMQYVVMVMVYVLM